MLKILTLEYFEKLIILSENQRSSAKSAGNKNFHFSNLLKVLIITILLQNERLNGTSDLGLLPSK